MTEILKNQKHYFAIQFIGFKQSYHQLANCNIFQISSIKFLSYLTKTKSTHSRCFYYLKAIYYLYQIISMLRCFAISLNETKYAQFNNKHYDPIIYEFFAKTNFAFSYAGLIGGSSFIFGLYLDYLMYFKIDPFSLDILFDVVVRNEEQMEQVLPIIKLKPKFDLIKYYKNELFYYKQKFKIDKISPFKQFPHFSFNTRFRVLFVSKLLEPFIYIILIIPSKFIFILKKLNLTFC